MDYLSTLRQAVGSARIPLVYSTVLIRDDTGRILFHYRTDFDTWGLPGGIVEVGESPADCARRETIEETGLCVEPVRLVAILSSPKYDVLYPNGDRVQQVSCYFECRIAGGSLQSERGIATPPAFFSEDNLPRTLPWYAAVLEKKAGGDPFFDPPEYAGAKIRRESASARRIGKAPPESTWAFLRSRIGSHPLVLPGAVALVRNEAGRVLLVRRADSGLWMFPGGLLELGESLAGTAARETEEETGLRIEPRRVRGLFGGHRVVFTTGDTVYPIAAWFECAIRSGSLQPDGEEVDRAEFFDPGALPEMVSGIRERWMRILASPGSAVFQ
jgi:ADP-ribose pyrophosphatase YjhB (NUDIX family)